MLVPAHPDALEQRMADWEAEAGCLWSSYLEADRRRAVILARYRSTCCERERYCHCDLQLFGTAEEKEAVSALDAEAKDVLARRIVYCRRLDRARRVLAQRHRPGLRLPRSTSKGCRVFMPVIGLRVVGLESWEPQEYIASTRIVRDSDATDAPSHELLNGPNLSVPEEEFRSLRVGRTYRIQLVEAS
jgi:hypothetical protein